MKHPTFYKCVALYYQETPIAHSKRLRKKAAESGSGDVFRYRADSGMEILGATTRIPQSHHQSNTLTTVQVPVPPPITLLPWSLPLMLTQTTFPKMMMSTNMKFQSLSQDAPYMSKKHFVSHATNSALLHDS